MRAWLALVLVGFLLGCAAPPPPGELKEQFAGEAVADPVLRDRVLAATHAYWAAMAAGKWREAYGFFTLDFQEKTSFIEWRRHYPEAWTDVARPISIRWTKEAHRSHGPELYAIVKWVAPSVAIESDGALIWRREPDGNFMLENDFLGARAASQ